MPIDNVNHVEEGLGLLLDQFNDKPGVVALLSSYLKQLQVIEDSLQEILKKRNIDDAYGFFLDQIGGIVGINREGASDEVFRLRIRIRVWINASNGSRDMLLNILQQSTQATVVKMFEHFPANLHFTTDGVVDLERAFRGLSDAASAGVGDVTIIEAPVDGVFIGSELVPSQFELVDMVDELGNVIQDNEGNDIIVTALSGRYTNVAKLEELPEYGGGQGKQFAEIHNKGRYE